MYLLTVIVEFAALPILLCTVAKNIIWQRSYNMLLLSLAALSVLPLMSISTIDPVDPAVRINKFYLLSFIPLSLLIGISLNYMLATFMRIKQFLIALLIIILGSYVFISFPKQNQSQNILSQQLVVDALTQLPSDSIVITDHHLFYFGSLYEQYIEHRFNTIRILYFVNENNHDAQIYNSDLYTDNPHNEFVKKIRQNWNINLMQSYVVDVVARNLDKPIFILQSTHNQTFFRFLEPYLQPYGLWWRLVLDTNTKPDLDKHMLLLDRLRDRQMHISASNAQQKKDLGTYAMAFYSLGRSYATQGQYSKAIDLLHISREKSVNPHYINQIIALISNIQFLESKRRTFVETSNKQQLLDLAVKYFTIGNHRESINTLLTILTFDPKDGKIYSNLGSNYAFLGEKEVARRHFRKALELDPYLDLAQQGLARLDKDQ